MYQNNQQLKSQEQYRQENLPEEQKQEASVQESAQFGNNVKQLMSILGQNMAQNNGKDSVTQYNMHEQQGRTGLVDPSLTQQQTTLPIMRRMEQSANFNAIMQSLPAEMQMNNQAIVKQVNSATPQLQRTMKMRSSIYAPVGSEGFVQNRLNMELQNRRFNSIYAVI